MKLEELYQKIGGDLETVMKRIPSEAMIGKFVRKYANDPTYNRLTAAVEAKNWKDAFLAAHTLKVSHRTSASTACKNRHPL